MKRIVTTLAAVAAFAALPALAQESAGFALAKKSNCTSCHAVDKKIVGPAYQDVAKKYAGQKDAEAKVFESITKGGVGKWGQVPMPAKGGNAALSDADAKTLAKWIVSGAK
jgi:cytochrome c